MILAIFHLVFLIALTAFIVSAQKHTIQEEVMAAQRITLQLLSTAAQGGRLMGPIRFVMLDFVSRLDAMRDIELRFHGQGGLDHIVPALTPNIETHIPTVYSTWMNPQLPVAVITISGAKIEVIADPRRAIAQAWLDLRNIVFLALASIVVVHTILLIFVWRILQPVEKLLAALRYLAKGDFRVRLPATNVAEWRELNTGFNSMAQELAQREESRAQLITTTRALTESRTIARETQIGIEAERTRLARELHDEFGQSVTAIHVIATALARSVPLAEQSAKKISEVAAEIYDGMQRIVRELRPSALDDVNLCSALATLVEEWRSFCPEIDLRLICSQVPDDIQESAKLPVYRAVQEALTNAMRHSATHKVTITVMVYQALLTISIENDGDALNKKLDSGGHGLASMRERIEAVSGKLETGPLASGGFAVRITLPVHGDFLHKDISEGKIE